MKKNGHLAMPLLAPVCFLGYISGGTGSMIIQVVIAFLVGGAFVIRLYWRKIKGLFRKEKAES
jgi:hypothetical protein